MFPDKIHLQTTSTDGVIRLLQITDTHLFAEASARLLGVTTFDSYSAVIDAIEAHPEPYEAVLATGDISQDQSDESYQKFIQQVKRLQKPTYWLPGNHDGSESMHKVLPDGGLRPFGQLIWPAWQLIMLDTQVPGVPHGMLSEQQLQQLETALASYPQKHALILLHHQPLPVGCAWLDQHSLKNAEQLFALLDRYPQVQGVVFGHVHQSFETERNGVKYLAAPSTCLQFTPLSDEFALDRQAPGWRYLQLHPDGRISTQVWHLPMGKYLPDTEAVGY
ncbi:3',5'-cyclic-AMP phosphodiesterase [Dongshaea marina]|uniref:3',5'-cyclic-AMP phosphodiesterase n=1 Tax=Dongshaea marina TaxID=2047966 RepID=UPI001F2486F4|nr:3',5'-cyclic-AMP phosphodiesterase [Dongshaea marina]